jgi:tetratricopeptide (TPR) repeat protein
MLESLVSTLPNSVYAHFYDDAVFCLAYVQSGILNDRTAYPKIVANVQRIDSSSLLKSYILSYSAVRTARTDEAIRVLENRPNGGEYQLYPYLDYLAGTARLRKLDFGSSHYFMAYLRTYRGINYIKDSYLNLAWISLLKGNAAGYKDYIQLVKSKGYSFHEKDKQALQEANDPIPDVDLLKARLLFDGGFYDRALNELKDKKAGDFKLLRDKIEFCYRLGRIYDETGRDELAIKFYQFAIDIGKKERYYFASNAAYRIGNIYAQKKNNAKARDYYNQAIDMEDHDYERSVEAKAKEGLSRLND